MAEICVKAQWVFVADHADGYYDYDFSGIEGLQMVDTVTVADPRENTVLCVTGTQACIDQIRADERFTEVVE